MFFNFRERPDQMFDRLTEVKLFNAKKVISDALIGSFKFDLGLVYDEVEHCFIHKWLLLTDPNDPSGGPKVCTLSLSLSLTPNEFLTSTLILRVI